MIDCRTFFFICWTFYKFAAKNFQCRYGYVKKKQGQNVFLSCLVPHKGVDMAALQMVGVDPGLSRPPTLPTSSCLKKKKVQKKVTNFSDSQRFAVPG